MARLGCDFGALVLSDFGARLNPTSLKVVAVLRGGSPTLFVSRGHAEHPCECFCLGLFNGVQKTSGVDALSAASARMMGSCPKSSMHETFRFTDFLFASPRASALALRVSPNGIVFFFFSKTK
jgi:hypothetical protein